MVRKPRNSNDLNSKFEKVVRELRAKFRGGVLHVNLRGRVVVPEALGRHQSSWPHCLAALSGRIVWPHLRSTLMKGGRDQEFRVIELCAAWATGIE